MSVAGKLLFFLLFLFSINICLRADNKGPEADIALKIRNDSEEGFSEMVEAGDLYYRLILMKFEDSGRFFYSLYTPHAAAGKIKANGLLREIKNPAGQNPGSPLFFEKTGISPDSSFIETGSSGIRLDAGKVFSVFGEESTALYGTLAWKGIYASYNPVRNLFLNCAVTEYRERNDRNKDFWYSERKTGYGRKIINSSMSVSLKNRFTGISGASAVTNTDGLEKGVFFRLSPWLAFSFIRVDFLLSGTNSYYIKPDGSYPGTGIRKGAAVILRPAEWMRLDTRYVTDLLHEKESDDNFCGYTEESFASFSLSPWFLTGSVFMKYRNSFRDDTLTVNADSGYSAGIRSSAGRMVFERKTAYQNRDLYSETISLEAGTIYKKGEFYVSGKIKKSIAEEKSAKARVKLKGRGISVFGEYEILVSVSGEEGKSQTSGEYKTGLEARF